MKNLFDDLRVTLRGLATRPGYTVIVVLTLALTIGANAGLATVRNALADHPIALPDMDRLAVVAQPRGYAERLVPPALFLEWQSKARQFQGLAAFMPERTRLDTEGQAAELLSYQVTGDFFSLLGVQTVLGRALSRDDIAKRDRVAVLSHGLWKTQFGSSPGVIGRRITIGKEAYQVIGVASEDTPYPLDSQVWTSLIPEPSQITLAARSAWRVVGRLAEGASISGAETELRVLHDRLVKPEPDRPVRLSLRPLAWTITGVQGDLLRSVASGSFVLLLVGGLNLGILLMARSLQRRKEIATSFALGSSRLGVVSKLFIEALVLSAIGAAMSLLLARWMIDLAGSSLGELAAMPGARNLHVGLHTLQHAAAVGLGMAALFALLPSVQISRMPLSEVLKQGGRSQSSGAAAARIRGILWVAQVGIAFVLLFVGISYLLTLNRVVDQRGFDGKPVIMARIDTALSGRIGLPGDEVQRQIVERLQSVPGISAAATVRREPYSPRPIVEPITLKGVGPKPEGTNVFTMITTPGLFKTLRIQLLAGRLLESQDGAGAPRVTVVSAELAKRYFGTPNVVGREIRFADPQDKNSKEPWYTIVGVAADIDSYPGQGQSPTLYLSAMQHVRRSFTVLARAEGLSTAAAISQVRDAIRSVAPSAPMSDLGSYHEFLERRMSGYRAATAIVLLCGILSLLIAGLGLHSSTSFLVTEREHEIGIRMAIGASRVRILGFIFGKVGRMIGLGLVVGLGLAVPILLSNPGDGLERELRDPTTFAWAISFLLLASFLAIVPPTTRALRLAPSEALRDG